MPSLLARCNNLGIRNLLLIPAQIRIQILSIVRFSRLPPVIGICRAAVPAQCRFHTIQGHRTSQGSPNWQHVGRRRLHKGLLRGARCVVATDGTDGSCRVARVSAPKLMPLHARADLARHNTRSAGTSKVGGRVDVAKEIEEIKFTASITDASARDYEATPWIRDFIVTAEKKLNGGAPLWGALVRTFGGESRLKIRGACPLHDCPKRTGMWGCSCPFSRHCSTLGSSGGIGG